MKNKGTVKRGDKAGSKFKNAFSTKTTYIDSITNSPCAKFIMFITPKIRAKPIAARAYTQPISRPLKILCIRSSIIFHHIKIKDGFRV